MRLWEKVAGMAYVSRKGAQQGRQCTCSQPWKPNVPYILGDHTVVLRIDNTVWMQVRRLGRREVFSAPSAGFEFCLSSYFSYGRANKSYIGSLVAYQYTSKLSRKFTIHEHITEAASSVPRGPSPCRKRHKRLGGWQHH